MIKKNKVAIIISMILITYFFIMGCATVNECRMVCLPGKDCASVCKPPEEW